jgi:hypothetical protein
MKTLIQGLTDYPHNSRFYENGKISWFASAPKSEELNLPTFLFPAWDTEAEQV